MDAIRIEHLSKTYRGGVKALDDLSLKVRAGEVFSLLGPNGAGKSTLIGVLTTVSAPSFGEIRVLGCDPVREAAAVRRKIACVTQTVSIEQHLTLPQNLLYQAALYGLSRAAARDRADLLIDSLGLAGLTDRRTGAYSGGVRRRLDIAMSLMSRPEILFLDEPTVGLDIESRRAMWDIVRTICGRLQATVFLTTHYLEEADELSDTVCIMRSGHEIVQDTPANLKRYTAEPRVRVDCEGERVTSRMAELLAGEPFARRVLRTPAGITVLVEHAARDYRSIERLVLESGLAHTGVGIAVPDLDDVFLELTGEGEAA